ncbi:unnamed protein product [Vitrella brassicaformis CCMP3155]|uniref:Cytokinin riboside 5'-monophosphate phosphoribohydrolase n=2 Tax=Vitrella brassicaformis TaxID=1169539 RepID=A0A0G4EU80_VITBC|nr:unnamed protein product [Vitrella brassicaformis CCMP3155]|eukprot:CEM01972.1 unnamed protein product [Vitrella brassicaformis CCMP3155]
MPISTNAEAFDSSPPASSSRFERNVAVFGSSSAAAGSGEYALAEEIGALLARRGCRVINGGYGGVMEATAKGAREAVPDAQVRGIIVPSIFRRRPKHGNDYLSDAFVAQSLVERLDHLTNDARVFIVLPGKIGTLTELMLVWNQADLAHHIDAEPPLVIAFREPFEPIVIVCMEALEMSEQTRSLVRLVDTPEEAVTLAGEYLDEREERAKAVEGS